MTLRNIAHVLPTISRNAGGPSVSVRRLVESLHDRSRDTQWQVFAGDSGVAESAGEDWRDVQMHVFRTRFPRRSGRAPAMPLALRASRPQLIHLHGLWLYHAWTAYRVARSAHIPLIVSPRGMLEPWALRQGRLQKAVAGVLFHRAMLRDATCIVATSAMEARSVRLAGVSAPIFVIPNGVDVPDESHAVRSPASLRTALFLSRIAPKKGLLELLVAWHAVAPAGWRLRIVGPDERGYADTVAHEIRRLGLESSVTLAGAAWGEDKRREYAAADLFALPSHSENFGMVVAEALAAGLPVITTRATPWAELETERCGWWIQTGAAALIPTLRDAVALPESELKAMGARGRQLVAARYAWPRVAEDMARIYCWVTGSGAEPSDLKFPR